MSKKQTTYRIIFFSQNTVYELYARNVIQENLYGFVEISDIVFGQTSDVLVDPAEERLKREFQGVEKTHVPLHAIIRIDEVEKEGVGKIRDISAQGNVKTFPSTFYSTTKPPTSEK